LFAFNFLTYLLILTNAVLLNYTSDVATLRDFTLARIVIDVVNLVIMIVCGGYFQVKMAFSQSHQFFSNPKYLNEVSFMLIFLAQFAIDVHRYRDLQGDINDLEGFNRS